MFSKWEARGLALFVIALIIMGMTWAVLAAIYATKDRTALTVFYLALAVAAQINFAQMCRIVVTHWDDFKRAIRGQV